MLLKPVTRVICGVKYYIVIFYLVSLYLVNQLSNYSAVFPSGLRKSEKKDLIGILIFGLVLTANDRSKCANLDCNRVSDYDSMELGIMLYFHHGYHFRSDVLLITGILLAFETCIYANFCEYSYYTLLEFLRMLYIWWNLCRVSCAFGYSAICWWVSGFARLCRCRNNSPLQMVAMFATSVAAV